MNTDTKFLSQHGCEVNHSLSPRVLELFNLNKCTPVAWKKSLVRWIMNVKQRRQLAKLPYHLLKDIGVTEFERQREISKPFWKN